MKYLILFFELFFFLSVFPLQRTISIAPTGVNDVLVIQTAIQTAKTYTGDTVTIKMGGGTYHIHRNQATAVKYYISNTLDYSASLANLKNVGVHITLAKNIILDGEGSTLLTHGEVSAIVIDQSENIQLRNLNIDAADPTVTEMTVETISGNDITYVAHSTSNFTVSGTSIKWAGEYGWTFSGGVAQMYDPMQDITWRVAYPTTNGTTVTDLGNQRVKVTYSAPPFVKVGWTYQMRDAVRDQVAGFIHKSKNIVFDHINYYFLGNFGIVCQYSDNLSFLNCHLAPQPGSGRTNAGFADFLQVSGCKGLLKVEDSYFSGAHDDPINVHGTYLKIQNYPSTNQVSVKFMHSQSWGFDAFFVGDSIEFVDVASMLSIQQAKITAVTRVDDRDIILTFDSPIDVAAFQAKTSGVVVENITWTPEVEIRRNYFSRIPTRGILLTTRRRSVIEDNTFFRMQMPGIYVSGDAASWYESGKVQNLTIRNNKFIECGSPTISFDPTNTVNSGYVHSNVVVDGNTFTITSGNAVGGKSVNNLTFTNNTIISTGSVSADNYCSVSNSSNVVKSGNKKIQPGYFPLVCATTNSSSSAASHDKSLAVDENASTYWSSDSGDAAKCWSVDLGKLLSIYGLKLTFPFSSAWKYIIEVSADNVVWTKVIDQSDNSTPVLSHYNTGELGRNIRYVRITFNSSEAALSELSVFGTENSAVKTNILTGTVIGTTGSYGNDPSSTKDAVFDFQPGSFFDAPSSLAWVGLDLGKDANYIVDSIRFAPRSSSASRMLNGTFEISNSPTFASTNLIYPITSIPIAGYTKVGNLRAVSGRYVRYSGPVNGYGNIAEAEFYGRTVGVRAPQNIAFGPLKDASLTDSDFELFATTSSGLPVTFFTSDPTVATIVAGKVHFLNPGTVNIIATQNGDINYLPATEVSQPLLIYPNNGDFSIRLDQLNYSPAINGNGAVQLNKSTSGNGLIIGGMTYNNGIGTHAPAEINIKLGGTSKTFIATVGVDDAVSSKPNETNLEYNVYLDNTLSWSSGAMKYTDAQRTKSINLDVTGKDILKLVVTIGADGLNYSDHADWVNTSITYTGIIPLCVASSVAVSRTSQTISFSALPSMRAGDPDYVLTATASSALPVLYASSDTTIASIIQGSIRPKKAGNVIIYANQFGNSLYTGAPCVVQPLTVLTRETGIYQPSSWSLQRVFPSICSNELFVQLSSSVCLLLQVSDIFGNTVFRKITSDTDGFNIPVCDFNNGIYILKLSDNNSLKTVKFIVKH